MTIQDQSINDAPAPHKKSPAIGFMIFSFMMMIILSIAAIQPLIPNDFFPYLRIGEEILRTGHIPTTEFMTYTRFGSPALYLYWFPSILLLEIYRLGGVLLTSIISLLCIGLFYTFLWLSLRELKIAALTSGLVLTLVSLVGASFFPTRPQILAFPLFGLALLIIVRWQNGRDRALWFLPLIALLWANIHGSFIVLFLILIPAAIFGSGNRKRLIIFSILSLLATFVNYYGVGLWANMFSIVGNQSNQLFGSEWKPPVNQGWQSYIFFGSLLLIPVLTAFAKSKIRFIYWIWYVGFGWMALTSIRYIVWFLPFEAILISFLANPNIEKLIQNSKRFQNRTFNLVISAILLVIPLTLIAGIRGYWWPQSPPVFDEGTPVKAAEWLKQNPQLPDNLWTNFSYSTYLTYALPERKLFTSNRIEDFPISQIEDYFNIAGAKYNWQSILTKYYINLVMADIKEQPDLILALSASAEWKEVYRDAQAVIFSKGQS